MERGNFDINSFLFVLTDVEYNNFWQNLPNNTTFQVGDSWNFQFWHRDNNPGVTSNTTAGVEVQICP